MSKGSVKFPSTDWDKLEAVRGSPTAAHRDILNTLMKRYWKPVYLFTVRSGYNEEDAQDLVQEFFCDTLHNDLFGKAHRDRGRFRSFLLRSYKNFLANSVRYQKASKRWPNHGFISVPDLVGGETRNAALASTETPETVFERTWVTELLQQVLKALQRECLATDKAQHYRIFRSRVVLPILNGSDMPSIDDLALEHGITKKQVSNRLVTMRRAFQRLLDEEIRTYAASEKELASETKDLLAYLKD